MNKNSSLFWKQLFNYIILVFVLLIVISILFLSIRNTYKDEVEATSLEIIGHIVEGLDGRLKEMKLIAGQIVSDSNVVEYSYMQSVERNVKFSHLMETYQNLPKYPDINSILYDTVVFFFDSGSFLSPLRLSNKQEEFYSTYLNYDGLTLDEWEELMMEGPFRDHYWPSRSIMTFDQKEKQIITFVKYFHDLIAPKGTISMMIDSDQLFRQVDLSILGEKGSFYIYDKYSEKIIASYQGDDAVIDQIHMNSQKSFNGEMQVEGESYYTVAQESNEQSLIYWAFVPYDSVMVEVQKTTYRGVIIIAVLFVFALGWSSVFSYITIKPVQEIISLLQDGETKLLRKEGSDYAVIKGGISDLMEMNSDLQFDLEREEMVLRSVFVSRLLLKEYSDEAMIREYLDHSQIRLLNDNYVLLTGKVQGDVLLSANEKLDRIDEMRILVSRAFKESLGLDLYIQNMEVDKVVCIISYPRTTYYEEIQIKIERLAQSLLEQHDIPMMFALSSQFNQIIDVPTHYDLNSKLLRECFPKRFNIIYCQDMYEENTLTYYSREQQEKVMASIKMGEGKRAYRMIEEILHDYSTIPSPKLKMLLSQIRSSLEKIEIVDNKNFDMKGYYIKLKRLARVVTIKRYLSDLEQIIEDIAGYFQESKESSNFALRDRILEFVGDHYDDPDLCLRMIADAMDISEKYLSRYFKDQTGNKLMNHIEDIRMKAAVELIKSTEVPLKEIAERVGYINTNTFYKAFKRKYDMSPGEYRKV